MKSPLQTDERTRQQERSENSSVSGGIIAKLTGPWPDNDQMHQEHVEIQRTKIKRRGITIAIIFLGLMLTGIAISAIMYLRLLRVGDAEGLRSGYSLAVQRANHPEIKGDGDSLHRAWGEVQTSLDARDSRGEPHRESHALKNRNIIEVSVETLRKVQDLQSEYSEHARRLDALERGAESIRDAQRAYADRQMAWRAELREFKSRLDAHTVHQRMAIGRVAEALRGVEPRPEARDPRRGSRKRSPDSAAGATIDTAAAWFAMDELSQSKFALAQLITDLDRLEREAKGLETSRREIFDRIHLWRSNITEAMYRIVDWRSRINALYSESEAGTAEESTAVPN